MDGKRRWVVLKGAFECLLGGVKPDLFLNSVLDFKPKEGISHIIFDLEGTLTGFMEIVPAPGIREKLDELKKGYNCLILSNRTPELDGNRTGFLKAVEENFGIPIVDNKYYKPSAGSIYECLRMMGKPNPKNVAIVGDVLATDILAARNAGLGLAVMVKGISPEIEPRYLKLVRPLERFLSKSSRYKSPE